MSRTEEIHEGSCCCGRVQYRMQGPYGTFSHCHCTDCRKTHGAAFATYIGVAGARFSFLEGESEVGSHTTETGTRRTFCRHCGSTLTGTVASEPENIYVATGTLDTPLHRKPEYHIFLRSKVPWIEIQDGLPQHQKFAE